MARYIDADKAREVGKYIPWCESDLVEKAIDRIPAADVIPARWIPVTERLPGEGKKVLVWTTQGDVEAAYLDDFGGWCVDFEAHVIHLGAEITHWMPLPKGPEGV